MLDDEQIRKKVTVSHIPSSIIWFSTFRSTDSFLLALSHDIISMILCRLSCQDLLRILCLCKYIHNDIIKRLQYCVKSVFGIDKARIKDLSILLW